MHRIQMHNSSSVSDFKTLFNSHVRSSSNATSIFSSSNSNPQHDEFVSICVQFDLMPKKAAEVSDEDLAALFEMALDCGGHADSKRESMRRFPKDQKLQLIKQVYCQCTSTAGHSVLQDAEKPPMFYIDALRNANSYLTSSIGKSMTNSIVQFVTRSSSHSSGSGHGGGGSVSGGRNGIPVKDILAQLRIQCKTSGEGWLRQFLDLGGLDVLFTLLRSIHGKKEKYPELEILKILKIAVNNEREINDLLARPEWINILTFSLDSPILPSRTSATDFLLALVALNYPKGHNLVIRAFETYRSEQSNLRLFERFLSTISEIVESRGTFGSLVGSKGYSGTKKDASSVAGIVSMNREKAHKDMKDYLISALALIRYIVQVPSQLEYRIHLRNELTACGLFRIFKKLKTWAPAENSGIMVHVTEFEARAQLDHDEFVDGMDAGICDDILDMEDEHKVLDVLMESYKQDISGREYVKSILKNLLIPTRMIDEVSRTKFLQLVDKLLSQMVLDGKGLQCDFLDTYRVPVDEILQGFVQLDEMEALKADIVKTKLKLSEITSEKRKLERDLEFPRSEQSNPKDIMKFSAMQDILRQKEMDLDDQSQKLARLKLKQDSFMQNLKQDLGQIYAAITANQGVLQKVDSAAFIPDDSTSIIPAIVTSPSPLPIPSVPLPPQIMNGGPPPPPPPPPPPGMAGRQSSPAPEVNSLGPPPPPPPMPGAPAPPIGLPKRVQKYKPTTEVRRLQWDRLPDGVIKESMWLKKINSVSLSIAVSADSPSKTDLETRLDAEGVFKDIQTRFGVKPKVLKPVVSDEQIKLESDSVPGMSNSTKPTEVTLIDGKKAQNMMIMLGRLRQYSASDLVKAVMSINEEIVSESIIKQLIVFLPTQDEAKTLKAFKGEFASLRKAEQFLMTILDIPSRNSVMDSILFKLSFAERFKALDEDLGYGLSAVACLDKCEKFLKVLEIVLSLGNFMNSGTFIGSVHGFRINSINKLADVKSTEGKGSLLHFLADVIDEKFPDLSGFAKELLDCIPAARLSIEVLKSDLKILQKGLKEMCSVIETLSNTQEKSENVDLYIGAVKPFSETASTSVNELTTRMTKLESGFRRIVSFFGEDPEKTPFDEFFGMFKLFLQSYERAEKENTIERDRLAKLEKRKRLQEERELQRAISSSKLLPTIKADSGNSSKGGNMMDDILASLKGGSLELDAPVSSTLDASGKRRPLSGTSGIWTQRKVSTNTLGNQALEMLEQLRD
ncbi:hypothetical protein BDR26DRAFT_873559 [Obelidium mucronatum]|nr:hypothetical protein BDR26DRAFT_873559 [Obelidium mucronatum]